MDPKNTRTHELWNPGTQAPRNYGILDSGINEFWNSGTKEFLTPCIQGCRNPWIYDFMNSGTRDFKSSGILEFRDQ